MSPSRKGSEKGVDLFLRINESHSNMTVSRCSSAVERHPMKSNVHRYLGKALNKRKQESLSLCQLVSSGKTWFVNMAELWTTLDNMWARNALAHGVRFQGCCGLCSPSRPATTGSVKYGPKRFSYLFSISSGSIRIHPDPSGSCFSMFAANIWKSFKQIQTETGFILFCFVSSSAT